MNEVENGDARCSCESLILLEADLSRGHSLAASARLSSDVNRANLHLVSAALRKPREFGAYE